MRQDFCNLIKILIVIKNCNLNMYLFIYICINKYNHMKKNIYFL